METKTKELLTKANSSIDKERCSAENTIIESLVTNDNPQVSVVEFMESKVDQQTRLTFLPYLKTIIDKFTDMVLNNQNKEIRNAVWARFIYMLYSLISAPDRDKCEENMELLKRVMCQNHNLLQDETINDFMKILMEVLSKDTQKAKVSELAKYISLFGYELSNRNLCMTADKIMDLAVDSDLPLELLYNLKEPTAEEVETLTRIAKDFTRKFYLHNKYLEIDETILKDKNILFAVLEICREEHISSKDVINAARSCLCRIVKKNVRQNIAKDYKLS